MKLKLLRSLLLCIFFSSAIATRAGSQITPNGTTNTTIDSTDNNITIARGNRYLCQLGQGSEFIVTGKGGIAPSPIQARDRDVGSVDLVKPVFSEAGGAGEAGEAEGAGEIVEAQGWIVNDRGMVELVASKTNIDRNPSQPKVQCRK